MHRIEERSGLVGRPNGGHSLWVRGEAARTSSAGGGGQRLGRVEAGAIMAMMEVVDAAGEE